MGETQSDAERKLEIELNALKHIHDLRIASLDAQYGEKLAYKYEKSSNLEDKAFAMITELTKYYIVFTVYLDGLLLWVVCFAFNRDLESLEEKLNNELHETMNDYEEKLKNKDEEILKVRDPNHKYRYSFM